MKYRLLKDLPGCFKGVIFEEVNEENIFIPSSMCPSSCPSHLKFFWNYINSNPEWFEKVEEFWKPKEGERYFYINNSFCYVIITIFVNSECHKERISIGNCFSTGKKAEECMYEIRNIFEKHRERI